MHDNAGRGWGGRRISGPRGGRRRRDSVKTALTELIEQDLGKAGKGKEVVEGGVDQGSSGGGGGAVRSGVEHFGGGKRAKVGMAAIPECQDSALLAKQVRIVSVDVCGF